MSASLLFENLTLKNGSYPREPVSTKKHFVIKLQHIIRVCHMLVSENVQPVDILLIYTKAGAKQVS